MSLQTLPKQKSLTYLNKPMAELNYNNFKRRVNILQDLLIDAGYSLKSRDGLRYPSLCSDGR